MTIQNRWRKWGLEVDMLRQFTRRIPFLANRLPSLEMFRYPTQYKYLYAWFQSRRKNYLIDHAIPWLTYDAIHFLKDTIKEESTVFEYGSGASTLFWASFNARCISIEHDPAWYAFIKKQFGPDASVEIRLVAPDPQIEAVKALDIEDPDSYQSDVIEFAPYTFRNYVTQIDEFPDRYFDVILVDGHARPSCIVHSVNKVKSGGMLILDNADMSHYLTRTSRYLANFMLHEFFGISPITGVMSQTNIYIAP